MNTQDVHYRLLSPRLYGTVAQTPLFPERALQNVIVDPLESGAMCIVGVCPAGPGGLFVLSKTSVDVVDGVNVLPTAKGVGRWIRLDAMALGTGAHEHSILNPFGEVVIPAGTLEANAVPIWTIGHGVVATLGYHSSYEFDVTLVMQVNLGDEGVPSNGTGVKFEWDLNGDGIYELEGARYVGFGIDAGFTYRTIVLRERITVPVAALGVPQTPVVRAVGWDTAQGAGWKTQEQVTSPDPNTLEWQFRWA